MENQEKKFMKEKKTKTFTKNVFLLLLIIFGISLCNQAYTQVTIGANKDPENYSVLELISNDQGGLRLPHLTTQDRDKLEDSKSRPFADDPNRAIPFLYEGLTIYNTDTRCLEYYNAQRWVSVCDGSSRMTINPAPCTQIAADGSGCDNEFTITDPDCVNGPFSFMVLVGDRYAELLDVDEWNGTFKIRFSANNSINSRSAVVRVRSGCTSLYKDFLFTQLGQSCNTSLGTAPEIKGTPAGKNITLYAGGAVYLHVDPPATQHLSELIWTRNNMEIARGVNYITVTQAGVYDVHMGIIGCNQLANNAVTVTRSGTPAPQPVSKLIAENGGLLCSPSGTVRLIALTSPTQPNTRVRWFKNGVLQGITSPDSEVNAGEGEWFAVVSTTDNAAWSTKTQTVVVSLDPNANNQLIAPSVSSNGNFCAGGTVYLSVTNPQPGYTYTWYENNTMLATGKSHLYSVPLGVERVVIRCKAVMGNACPAEYMATKNIMTGTIPAQPVITGNTILCNGSATLNAIVQGSGNYTYAWYKDNDSIDSGINRRQITVTSGGNYYVTVSDGCASSAGHINIPTTGSASPIVTLVSSSTKPDGATLNDEVTYRASITFGPATNYIWTITGATRSSGGQPGDDYVVVKFDTQGTASVAVEAYNACGKGSATQNVTVGTVCAAPDPATVHPSGETDVNVILGSNFTLGPVSVSFQAGSPQTKYQWYRNTTKSTNGATPVSGATNNTLVTSESAIGTYYYYCTMTNANCSTSSVETGFYTVKVATIPAKTGVGLFTGKTCFDIAYSNSGGSCGTVANRTRGKTDFADNTEEDPQAGTSIAPYSGTQIYTFTPSGTVSNVRFTYVDPSNQAIERMEPKGTYNVNNISGPCKVKVVYKPSLNTTLRGRTSNQALKPKLYVIYNDAAGGTGDDCRLELTVSLQDCACCEAATSTGGRMNFMCHNLGANTNLDPFTWNNSMGDAGDADIKGYLFQWGRNADGHEKRRSAVTSTLSTSNRPNHPHFITSTADPYDWYFSASVGGRWGDGVQINQSIVSRKGDNDPCPDGWQIPTWLQWSSIFIGGTTFGSPNIATANTWTWTGHGFMVGSGLYLPAAGSRRYNNGALEGIGDVGFYWSSSVTGNNSYHLFFDSKEVSPVNVNLRSAGKSIRCVSQ